jgi:hypothetical protein
LEVAGFPQDLWKACRMPLRLCAKGLPSPMNCRLPLRVLTDSLTLLTCLPVGQRDFPGFRKDSVA